MRKKHFFLTLSFALCACSMDLFKRPKIFLTKVTLACDSDMNNETATQVHVVVCKKEDVLKNLSTMSAKAYFQKIEAMIANDPNQESLCVIKVDVIPGQRFDVPIDIPNNKSVGGFVFSSYSSKGDHRRAIGDEDALIIHLKRDDFEMNKPG